MRALNLYFFFLFLGLLFSASGQPGDLASLRAGLAAAEGRERVDLLNSLSSQLERSEPGQAEAYGEEAFDLSQKLGYQEGIATSAFFLGKIEKEANHLRKAARTVETGVAAARTLKDQGLELQGLELLIEIYRLDKRNKKLAEAELQWQQLKNRLALSQRSEELAELKDEYESKEEALQQSETEKMKIQGILNLTIEDKLRQEAELQRLAREKAELELKTLQLENEATQNALAVSEKEKEILQYDARLKRQQFLQILMGIGFVVALLIIGAFVWYFKEKRERAEEKLTLQRQLMTQEKMATLGQLTAGIAHEIKNPLNFVNNFAEGSSELAEDLAATISQNKEDLNPDQYSLMGEIIQDLKQNARDIILNGQRLDRIVHSMMEHARGDKGKLQMVEINPLVADTVNLAYHGYRALDPAFNVSIEHDLDPSLEAIEAIPQDLSRVLLNILNNACYALSRKNKETAEDYPAKLKVSTRSRSGEVEIRIWDNGPGIPPAIRDKIFTPFFTTKPTGEGNTGLGLSISYDLIVQGHNGELLVESEPGEFTEFTVRLPVQQAGRATDDSRPGAMA